MRCAFMRKGLGCLLALSLAAPVAAQPAAFIDVAPPKGHAPVHVAAGQIVRIARVDGYTVIDTAAWVQQRTTEAVDAVARRVMATGQRLLPLTDPANARVWLSVDRVVIVRDSQARHAAGARAAIVMVGLYYGRDVAVRETVAEVMAALQREAAAAPH